MKHEFNEVLFTSLRSQNTYDLYAIMICLPLVCRAYRVRVTLMTEYRSACWYKQASHATLFSNMRTRVTSPFKRLHNCSCCSHCIFELSRALPVSIGFPPLPLYVRLDILIEKSISLPFNHVVTLNYNNDKSTHSLQL